MKLPPLDLRSMLWLAFFAAILAAWWIMYMMAQMSGLDALGNPTGPNLMPMTRTAVLFPMWAVMMAAMMGPTLVPTLAAYEDLIKSADGTRAGWLGLASGYFAVWIGFALLISALQAGLAAAGAVDALGRATSEWLAAALLAGTGIYQFTWTKQVCQSVCLSPMGYFLGRWRPGFSGGARMGLGLGAFCAGCCWGFMALGFVGGTMNLLWMGLATLFMVLEKLPQAAALVTRPLGVCLALAGIWLAGRALGMV